MSGCVIVPVAAPTCRNVTTVTRVVGLHYLGEGIRTAGSVKVTNVDRPATTVIHGDVVARHGAVVPPIEQAATFGASSDEAFIAQATTPFADEFYVRYGTPNHTQVGEVLAALEGGERALVTASGMGAISTLALSILQSGDHVILQRSTYPGTTDLLTGLLHRFGVTTTLVNQRDPASLHQALQIPTAAVFLETPTNPRLDVTDLRAFSDMAHHAGAVVVVDNTVATPINQRPLEWGADLVWHSATKYLGGHSDVSAGVIVGSNELVTALWRTHKTLGAVLGPFDAWLLLRGIRTLDVRMQRHNENGEALATFLAAHGDVTQVNYPGLSTHPQYELAARQMTGFSSLLSFVARGGVERADRLLDALRLSVRAASLGGVHSIATRPAAMWHGRVAHADDDLVDEALIRVSVGIESSRDVCLDFEQALAVSSSHSA
jgi:methionine-gamma-lyase